MLDGGRRGKGDRKQNKLRLLTRARICKRLRSPGIYSSESIPPPYVTWRAGTSKSTVVPARQARNRFLGSLTGLQIRAQGCGSALI
jgi:hypothetical protein